MKNIKLPNAVLAQHAAAQHCGVSAEGGRIVLTTEQMHSADTVRHKLEALGIVEQDIADAVTWARAQNNDQVRRA